MRRRFRQLHGAHLLQGDLRPCGGGVGAGLRREDAQEVRRGQDLRQGRKEHFAGTGRGGPAGQQGPGDTLLGLRVAAAEGLPPLARRDSQRT